MIQHALTKTRKVTYIQFHKDQLESRRQCLEFALGRMVWDKHSIDPRPDIFLVTDRGVLTVLDGDYLVKDDLGVVSIVDGDSFRDYLIDFGRDLDILKEATGEGIYYEKGDELC